MERGDKKRSIILKELYFGNENTVPLIGLLHEKAKPTDPAAVLDVESSFFNKAEDQDLLEIHTVNPNSEPE